MVEVNAWVVLVADNIELLSIKSPIELPTKLETRPQGMMKYNSFNLIEYLQVYSVHNDMVD